MVKPFIDPAEAPATPYVNFLSGFFDVGTWRIPFFSSTLTFEEAAKTLKLSDDVPGVQAEDWTISELYQRDIDWVRVEGPLLQYLLSTGEPQFFNALTIALMPYDKNKAVVRTEFAGYDDWQPPFIVSEENYQKIVQVGPIKFCFYEDWTSVDDAGFLLGKLRWNPQQIHAVAIDGQHRLAAIKRFMELGQHSTSRVPVIFLVFDEQIGFNGPESATTTKMMRQIFIHLNKHARVVNRARQILLDDQDPFSRCVRALVADNLEPNLLSLEANPPRLPLALVDWHTEQAKFDSGPYLLTVLGADWLVSLILGQKPVSDMQSYSKLDQQIRSLSSKLNVSLDSALSRLEMCKSTLTPFSFDDADLNSIAVGFRNTWNRALTILLTQFAPYSEFIALRESGLSLTSDWQWWYKLSHAAADGAEKSREELREFLLVLSKRAGAPSEDSMKKTLEDLDLFKQNNLAFNVVFQRAFFHAFYQFVQFKDADIGQIEDWMSESDFDLDDLADEVAVAHVMADKVIEPVYEDDDEAAITFDSGSDHREVARASAFVRAMNRLVQVFPELLDVSGKVEDGEGLTVDFWEGSFRKPGGGIDFTLGAGTRAGDLLYMAVCIAFVLEHDPDQQLDFDDFWAEVLDGSDFEPFKKMFRVNRKLWFGEASLGGRILKGRDLEYDEVLSKDEIEGRLRAVWALLVP